MIIKPLIAILLVSLCFSIPFSVYAETTFKTETFTIDASNVIGYKVYPLFMSSQKISSGVFALLSATTGIKSNNTKISPQSTGKYLFTPNSSSSSIGLPNSFTSGFKTVAYPNILIDQFEIDADISSSNTFSGSLLVRLSSGVIPVNFTKFLVLPSQAFASAKQQLRFNVFLNKTFSLKTDFYVELGLQVNSLTATKPVITLNLNSMQTTAIVLPDTTTNKAFWKTGANALSPYSNPDIANNEFDTGKYSRVQTEDSKTANDSVGVSVSGRWANIAHLFTFETSGYSSITDITIKWKGYYAYVGNVPTIYELMAYKATAWENVNAFTTTNTEYSKSLGNGALYFYSTSKIRFGVIEGLQKEDASSTLYMHSDYASITITYGVTEYKFSFSDVSKTTETIVNIYYLPYSFSEISKTTESISNKMFLFFVFSDTSKTLESIFNPNIFQFVFSDVSKTSEAINYLVNMVYSFAEVSKTVESLASQLAFSFSFSEVSHTIESILNNFELRFRFYDVSRTFVSFNFVSPVVSFFSPFLWIIIFTVSLLLILVLYETKKDRK